LNLKEWLGPFRVQIAGGEIFIRDDVVDLVRFASSNDVLIGIVTNGTLLDGELGERLIDAGLGFLDISLDGVNPQTHDNIRGVNGVYEKAMSSILNINHLRKKKNSNLVMYLSTIVMGYNMNELVDIVHLVEREHLDGVMLHPLGPPHDEGPNWWERSDLWPKAEELNKLYRIIDTLISMKEEGARIINSIDQFMEMKPYFRDPSAWRGTNCPVGVTNFLLSVDGNIHFCLKQPPIGKYTDPLDQVWASEAARKMRSEIKACSLECSPGNFAFRRSLFKEIRRYLKYK
jgi:MoaA/NifB/PqqE/SkfB family radical SAM enzyme